LENVELKNEQGTNCNYMFENVSVMDQLQMTKTTEIV
jgi:hypothetical protein